MRTDTAFRLGLFILLLAWPRVIARPAGADEPPDPLDPPIVAAGLPLPDGTWIFPHLGLVAPPAEPGTRWVVEKVGAREFAGRSVDVYQFVSAEGARGRPYYAQADFVDPSTGEVVGGRWGRGEPAVSEALIAGCGGAESRASAGAR